MKKIVNLRIAEDQDYTVVKVGHLEISAERIEDDFWGVRVEIENTLTNTIIVSEEYDSDGYIEYTLGRNTYCVDGGMEKLPEFTALK